MRTILRACFARNGGTSRALFSSLEWRDSITLISQNLENLDETHSFFPSFVSTSFSLANCRWKCEEEEKRNEIYFGETPWRPPSFLRPWAEPCSQCNGGGHAGKSAPRPLVAVAFKNREPPYRPTTTTTKTTTLFLRSQRRRRRPCTQPRPAPSTGPGMRDVRPLAC